MGTSPCAFIRIRSGCSSLQAMHQDANTLTSDTSPLRSAVDRPSVRRRTGAKVNSGTGFPTNAEGTRFGSRLRLRPKAAMSATKAATGTRNSRRRRRAESDDRLAGAPAAFGVFATAMSLHHRVHAVRALRDLVNFEGRGLLAVHAWRTERHAGKRNAGNPRFFSEQTIDDIDWYVPSNDVATDQ